LGNRGHYAKVRTADRADRVGVAGFEFVSQAPASQVKREHVPFVIDGVR
jgi:hypothetical protein